MDLGVTMPVSFSKKLANLNLNFLKYILRPSNVNDKIFFRGDGTNSYDDIMKVLGLVSKAGFPNVTLVTDTD